MYVMNTDNKNCPKSFRFDAATNDMLNQLKSKMGVSQADIVRLGIRKLFEKECLKSEPAKQ